MTFPKNILLEKSECPLKAVSGGVVKIHFRKKPRHFQEKIPDHQSAIGKYCRYAKVLIGFKRQFFIRKILCNFSGRLIRFRLLLLPVNCACRDDLTWPEIALATFLLKAYDDLTSDDC
jgi:hypothetical protein